MCYSFAQRFTDYYLIFRIPRLFSPGFCMFRKTLHETCPTECNFPKISEEISEHFIATSTTMFAASMTS